MSRNESEPKSLPKGLLAGLIGGLAGVLAMAAAERLIALRTRKDSQLAAPPLDRMHWSFGAAVGAAYGAAAEYFPAATARQGATFGLALEAFAREGTLPAVGLLTGSAPTVAPSDTAASVTSHVVYGVTTEVVRHFVRNHL